MKNNKKIIPDNPQKHYNKDKSIGLFVFNYNFEEEKRNCKEIVRGKISSKGDVYIFPFLQFQKDHSFHESFHTPKKGKPSKFHWAEEDLPKKAPVFGTKDLLAALRFAHFRARKPPCFCFRRGKKLNSNEITKIVKNLLRYVPKRVNEEKVTSGLKEKGFYQATLFKLSSQQ